ncbi:UNVERIFIED_ORG: hypothetical protein LHK14_01180 [Roseateles sp. XES5]|nr:hypothetical protein [Roseateles sp. XES5]
MRSRSTRPNSPCRTATNKLEDAFGAARSYLHAIRMAAAGLQNDRDMCALDLLAEQAEHELNQAQAIADTLMEDVNAR